jgi:hypothetical protein
VAFFVPALIIVSRLAAPFVARHLLGQGARQVLLGIGGRQLGRATVSQIARGAAISGDAMTYASAISQYSRTGEVDIKEALGEGLTAAASVGAGIAIFPPIHAGMSGAQLGQMLLQTAVGSTVVATGLFGGRVLVTDQDPAEIAWSTYAQVPATLGGRLMISRVFVQQGGLASMRGIVTDNIRSISQEVLFREMLWSDAPNETSEVGNAEFARTRPIQLGDQVVACSWENCCACDLAP